MANTELIKKLRDMTQAGVMDAMKALKECNDNLEKAAQWLREKGIAKASKKAGAIVTEGVVKAIVNDNYAALVEINSQTDFVASNEGFINLVKEIKSLVSSHQPKDLDHLNKLKTSSGVTIADACVDLTAKTGEKIVVRRISVLNKQKEQFFQVYEHFNNKIAVILLVDNLKEEVAKGVAMHIAALNPKFMSITDVSKDWIEKEKEILTKQTLAEGKPADRVEMIVKGRINKSMAEVCLFEQKFFKDPGKTVANYLKENGVNLLKFIRYEVGEGVEKKVTDFAAEVAEQMAK